MCGILGAFGPSITERHLEARLDLLRLRGDRATSETTSGPGFFLGCHRLAIMDPEQGMQPLSNEDGTIQVVSNGEIYNHEELRGELWHHQFRSRCDTEVIVRLYQTYGPWRFGSLSGMFAFIMYDARYNMYYAVRDPLGIKPLYYVHEPFHGNIIFASEKKCLLDLDGPIRTVPPGNIVTPYGVYPYISIASYPTTFSQHKLVQLLDVAVRDQLQADRPLGIFLSGGLDSSIVAYHASQVMRKLKAFSIGVNGSEDLVYAKKLAETLDVDHYVREVSPSEIIDAIPTVIWHLESYNPTMVRVGISAYLVSQLAAKHVSCVLVGEGADELFLGYPAIQDYPAYLWDHLFRIGVHQLYRTELQRLDRVSMACSLEARLPFLDLSLVRYVLGLPVTDKLRMVNNKWVEKWCLRNAYRGKLPPFIVDRPKVPFDQGSGIATILQDTAETNLSDSEYQYEKSVYPFLHDANKESVYYFRIWRYYFARDNEIYLGDAGRYYARDEPISHCFVG